MQDILKEISADIKFSFHSNIYSSLFSRGGRRLELLPISPSLFIKLIRTLARANILMCLMRENIRMCKGEVIYISLKPWQEVENSE